MSETPPGAKMLLKRMKFDAKKGAFNGCAV
jgi:hypothetical protein